MPWLLRMENPASLKPPQRRPHEASNDPQTHQKFQRRQNQKSTQTSYNQPGGASSSRHHHNPPFSQGGNNLKMKHLSSEDHFRQQLLPLSGASNLHTPDSAELKFNDISTPPSTFAFNP